MDVLHGVAWVSLGAALLVGAQDATGTSSAARLFEGWRNELVLVTAGRASGSGFVCGAEGKAYVVTCAHVLRSGESPSIRFLDGKEVSWSQVEFAEDADLARLELKGQREAEKHAVRTEPPQMGEPVVVVGNSGGYGVVTAETGKVVGIGVGVLEVTARVHPGVSGAPILDGDGKVLGVASHGSVPQPANPFATGREPSEPRRFGLVLAGRKWTKVDWAEYSVHARRLSGLDVLIRHDLGKLVFHALDRQSRGKSAIPCVSPHSGGDSSAVLPGPSWKRAVADLYEAEKGLRALAGRLADGTDGKAPDAWRAMAERRDAVLRRCLTDAASELAGTKWEAPLRMRSEELAARIGMLTKEAERIAAADAAKLAAVNVAPATARPGQSGGAPVQLSPEPGAVLPQMDKPWVFKWEAVEGATRYELFVTNETMGRAFLNPVVAEPVYVRRPPARRGGYLGVTKGWIWRVRSRDRQGVWGPWSPDRPFEVEPRQAD